MRFLAERLGFVGWGSSGAWRADAGKDEGDFGVFSWDEGCESGTAFDEVDDGGDAFLVLEGGKHWRGFRDGYGIVLVVFGCWRLL